MSPVAGFATFLSATVLLLVAVVVTGLTARVRAHVPLVFLTLAALGLAIYFARELGKHFDLAATGALLPVHLAVAKTATASYALPLITGFLTLRNRARRRVHFWAAILTLCLTVATAVTGTWMILVAPWKG